MPPSAVTPEQAALAYAELPVILYAYLVDPAATDTRPKDGSAYLYRKGFEAVLSKMAADGIPYPPTVAQVVQTAASVISPSRQGQFRAGWKWACKAAAANAAARPGEPQAQIAAMFPEPASARDNPGTREGKSKHPAGLAICMWVEMFGADLDLAATKTYHDANIALHHVSPQTRHDAVLGALKAVRHFCYGDLELGTFDQPLRDPIFRDPQTLKPFTPDDFKGVIKAEGLTVTQIKKGYFLNDVIWEQTDGETYVGCTFQFDIQTARGLTVPMLPHQVGPMKITPRGPERVIVDEPFLTLNDPRDPFTPKSAENRREVYARSGETIDVGVNEWWKAYYEFHCVCHGPPEKSKTKVQSFMDEHFSSDIKDPARNLFLVNFLGQGAQQLFDPDWKGPKELDAPVAPVPIPEPLPPPPKPKVLPAAPGQTEVLPGAMPAGKCSDCALRDDPDCASRVATNAGCEFFATAEDLEDPQ